MLQNTVPDFMGQIQSFTIFFEKINNPETLFIVVKPAGMYFPQNVLSCMTEWRMAEVVSKSNSFCQILIQSQCLCYCPCDLRYLKHMSEACPLVVAFRREENLCFMLEPSECF